MGNTQTTNMQIILRNCGQDLIIECDPNDPISYLSAFVPYAHQICHNGMLLSPQATVSQCGLQQGTVLMVVMCINAGQPSPNSPALANWQKLKAIPSFCGTVTNECEGYVEEPLRSSYRCSHSYPIANGHCVAVVNRPSSAWGSRPGSAANCYA